MIVSVAALVMGQAQAVGPAPVAPPSLNGQVVLDIRKDGQAVGRARVTQKIADTGEKQVDVRMDLPDDRSIRLKTTYDATGRPKFISREILLSNRLERANIVRFLRQEVDFLDDRNGIRQVKRIPYPEGGNLADARNFWFIRDTPTPGQGFAFFQFNIDTQGWDEQRVQFVAKMDIPDRPKTVGYRVDSVSGDRWIHSYVDTIGLPYRVLSSDGLLMERIS